MTKYHTAAKAGSMTAMPVQSGPSLHGIPPGMANKRFTATAKIMPSNAPANIKRRERLHRPSGLDCMACLQPPCRATMINGATMRDTPTIPRKLTLRIGTMLQSITATRFHFSCLGSVLIPPVDDAECKGHEEQERQGVQDQGKEPFSYWFTCHGLVAMMLSAATSKSSSV